MGDDLIVAICAVIDTLMQQGASQAQQWPQAEAAPENAWRRHEARRRPG